MQPFIWCVSVLIVIFTVILVQPLVYCLCLSVSGCDFCGGSVATFHLMSFCFSLWFLQLFWCSLWFDVFVFLFQVVIFKVALVQPLVWCLCLSVSGGDFYGGSGAAFGLMSLSFCFRLWFLRWLWCSLWFDVFVFLFQVVIFTVALVQPLVWCLCLSVSGCDFYGGSGAAFGLMSLSFCFRLWFLWWLWCSLWFDVFIFLFQVVIFTVALVQPLVWCLCLSVSDCDFYGVSGTAFGLMSSFFLFQVVIFTVALVQPLA